MCRGVAAGLRHQDIQKGDVIGILSPNCLEYMCIVLGCAAVGATVTTISPYYTVCE